MKERYRRKAARVAAFLFLAEIMSSAAIASLNISPVRVDLSAENDKDTVRITNQESSAKSYEVEVVAWTQTDEKREVYSPTDDVLAVPPLFTLNPGEEQVIRVGMLTTADSEMEKSYRMFITEIATPDDEQNKTTGIKMRLQIGVPVFIAPEAMPTARLSFVESTRIGDQTFIRFRNTGNTHIKTREVRWSGPGIESETVTAAVGYILPGKTGFLPVDLPSGDQVGAITVVTENLGAMEYELPLAP
jgi:fimbrial chaperone protein